MLLRVCCHLCSPFCLKVMFSSPSQHLENNLYLYFPWPFSSGPFFFLCSAVFSILHQCLSPSCSCLISLCPHGLMLSLSFTCSSDFAQCVFEKAEVVYGSVLCWSLPTFCSTQVFSQEFCQLLLHALTDSVKFPLKVRVDPETSTSNNPGKS